MIKVIALLIHIMFPDGDTNTLMEVHDGDTSKYFTMERCVETAPDALEAFKKQYPSARITVGCTEMEIKAPGQTL